MSYGFEVYNADGNIIIDQNYGTTLPVEPLGFPSTVPANSVQFTVFPGYSTYSGNVLNSDIVIAQPNRNPADPNEAVYVGGMNGLWGFNSPVMAPYGTKYYRLRKISSVSQEEYGLVVYEEDGVTPTFDSNQLSSIFNVVAKPFSTDGTLAWYDIPSGENIDDYFVILQKETSTAFTVDFGAGNFTSITYKGAAVYDFANNRIAFRYGTGTTIFASSGTIGRIS